MIDYARITTKAGDGGNGAGSFTHIKGKRYGKADGGDGGHGGHVYLEATRDLNTLEPFRYVKEYKAQNGQNGLSQRRRGADGEDLVIKVPVGTVVVTGPVEINAGPAARSPRPTSSLGANVDAEPQTSSDAAGARRGTPTRVTHSSTYDLAEAGQKVLMARGGEGGRGNAHLRDEYGRRPRSAEKGQEGEQTQLVLELKLIADVGLIGLPNAGKSTLIGALTQAKPKVAAYPFTTLEANLGVLSASSDQRLASSEKMKSLNAKLLTTKRSIVVADIPGLIEGASEGRGLGDLFLRHIERTKILVHLVDCSTDSEKQSLRSSPLDKLRIADLKWQDYQIVRGELRNYSKDLVKKKEIIVLTKVDLVSENKRDQMVAMFKAKRKKVVAISAVSREGLGNLIKLITNATG